MADLTINLAAICTPADYNTRPPDTIYSNFIDALPVVKYCSENNKRLIHFSTCEVYGKTIGIFLPKYHPLRQGKKKSPGKRITGFQSCWLIAANRLQAMFDRQCAIKLSGMSEKAYNRSFNAMQNGLGVKNKVDVRELGIQFGCVRLIPFVQKGLSFYKKRFIDALPTSRRASADFTRPVFTAVAFYLCAKRHKPKVDKLKLIELCGTSESEFTSVSTSMKDLCFDVLGTSKEKKDPTTVKHPTTVKGHRGNDVFGTSKEKMRK